MSLGYQKGNTWVPDTRFAAYAQRDSYKALSRAIVKAGFTTNVEYSYTSRRYMAEIVTYERPQGSDHLYRIQHGNAYDANPMAALTRAIRESGRTTPLLLACCLEIECGLLADALADARAREKKQAELEARLNAALDDLSRLIKIAGHRFAYAGDPRSAELDDFLPLMVKREPTFKHYPEDDDDL